MDYKTVSLSDQVFEHLESNILSGKYQRGDIITELQLCSELGVSRTPIREALRRLYQEHLIEDSGKNTVVLGISPQDFRDMCAIRIRIEGLAGDLHKIPPERRIADIAALDEAQLHARSVRHREEEMRLIRRVVDAAVCSALIKRLADESLHRSVT